MRSGETFAERFLIERLAGRGGMGEVYRAQDQSTGQPVAIKMLLAEDDGNVDRFAREARMLSSLEHPGIVRHIAHGALDGQPYLVMEWLEGEDLAARLQRGPLDAMVAMGLVTSVAEALGVLHERGIVHRDLKPSNIFLSGGSIEHVKLLDFGIASSATLSKITQTGAVLGTASYMAPEQANGARTLDARADVFSLGCVLFECLSGQKAFDGAHLVAILTKILFNETPRLQDIRPGLPDSLYALLDAMLAKLPGDRPANGHAVAQALRAIEDVPRLSIAPTVQQAPRASLLTGSEQRAAALIFIGTSPAPDAAADERLAAIASAHGARFERLFDGSAVALLSGASVATDLAAKAAHCALALKEQAQGRRISLSLGWNDVTGRLPLGPAIDRAANLLKTSAADTTSEHVALDEGAIGLLEARFEVGKVGRAFVLRDERDITDVRTLLGKPTPFVGRDRDVRRIEELLDECIGDTRATVAIVTGPAGMGKSRLGREIVHKIRVRDDAPAVWIARGQLLGAGSALGMLSELVLHACGIRAGESLDLRRDKLIMRVNECVPEAQRTRVAAFLGEAIGAKFADEKLPQLLSARRDAQLMSDLIREAFTEFVKSSCEKRPVVILLEDLHWGDGATVKILDGVMRDLREKPVFVLALARPEVHDAFPKLWQDRNLQAIRLNQLGKKASEELVKHVLGANVVPELVERIVRLADGNAFYLEELIRKAAEGPGTELPETVVAMVQSRLTALDDVLRRLLRVASIFGEVFWAGGVSALLGNAIETGPVAERLRELCEGEFATKRRDSRFAREDEYAFRHALLREGAYAMLTDDDRVLGHKLAGQWLEQRGESDALVLAEHFEKGGEGEKAAAFYLRAAEMACTGGDSEAAMRIVERGLRAGPSKDVRLELLGIFCEATAWAINSAELGIARANEVLAAAVSGSIAWARAVLMKLVGCAFLGRMAELMEMIPTVLAVVSQPGAEHSVVISLTSFAYLLDLGGMRQVSDSLVDRAQEVAHADPTMLAQKQLDAFQALRAAYAHEDPGLCVQAARRAYRGHGRLDEATRNSHALGYAHLGAWEDADRIWQEMRISDMDLGYVSSFRPFMQAWMNADREALDAARERAERLVEMGRSYGRALAENHGHWVLAEVLRRMGELDRADQEIQPALSGAIPLDKPGVLATLAALRLAQNKVDEALAVAEEGMQKYEEMRACSLFFRGGFLRVVHIECLLASGRIDEANAAIATTHDWLLAIAAKIEDEEYRASFLNNVPENRRIAQLATTLPLDAAAKPASHAPLQGASS